VNQEHARMDFGTDFETWHSFQDFPSHLLQSQGTKTKVKGVSWA
jgi:hypothetical protein